MYHAEEISRKDAKGAKRAAWSDTLHGFAEGTQMLRIRLGAARCGDFIIPKQKVLLISPYGIPLAVMW
jgi:hypothetical protein